MPPPGSQADEIQSLMELLGPVGGDGPKQMTTVRGSITATGDSVAVLHLGARVGLARRGHLCQLAKDEQELVRKSRRLVRGMLSRGNQHMWVRRGGRDVHLGRAPTRLRSVDFILRLWESPWRLTGKREEDEDHPFWSEWGSTLLLSAWPRHTTSLHSPSLTVAKMK